MERAHDILVRTNNPQALDETVQQLGTAAVIQAQTPSGYLSVDGCWVVRVFGDPGFIWFAITQQGYGEVVRELAEPI